jgi:hypothetical protein
MSWRTIIVPQHVYDEIMRRAKEKRIPAWRVIAELLNLASPSLPSAPVSDLDAIKQRLAELEKQLAELKKQLAGGPSGEISNTGSMLGPHAHEVQSVDPQLPDFVKSNPWLHVIAQRQ